MKPNIPIQNINPALQAQIDRAFQLYHGANDKDALKPNIKKVLRVMDEQTAINRYTWTNLPNGLTGQMIERILYYNGQGMFFYVPELKQFYFLPYALDGTIDIYGRYTSVKPLPFNGSTEIKKDDKMHPLAKYITELSREPIYDVYVNELKPSDLGKYCVLLSDYSKQRSQTTIPRQQLNDPILDVMADCIPFMRTALLSGTGVLGMRVGDESEAPLVDLASESIDDAALTGRKYIPVVGSMEFQELTGAAISKSEEYLLALQSLDNFRLSTYGLDNGGLFQKKSHVLEAEQEMNQGCVGLINQDGLTLRQHACLMFYSITGWPIWCEVSENVISMDTDMNGVVEDTQEPTGAPAGESNEG